MKMQVSAEVNLPGLHCLTLGAIKQNKNHLRKGIQKIRGGKTNYVSAVFGVLVFFFPQVNL